jgi:hypothetical protein
MRHALEDQIHQRQALDEIAAVDDLVTTLDETPERRGHDRLRGCADFPVARAARSEALLKHFQMTRLVERLLRAEVSASASGALRVNAPDTRSAASSKITKSDKVEAMDLPQRRVIDDDARHGRTRLRI